MKVKKVLAVLMAVMMLVSSMGMTAFAAETQPTEVPDAVVLVQVENPYCTELVNIADELTAVIKCNLNGTATEVAKVPVVKAEATEEDEVVTVWMGAEMDAVEASMMDQLKALQADINFEELANLDMDTEEGMAAAEELSTRLTEIMTSYTVELTGPNGETYEHYKTTVPESTMGMVVTSDWANQMIKMMGEMFEIEVTEETTVTELVNAALSYLYDEEGVTLERFLQDMEMTDAEIAEVMNAMQQIEDAFAYMRSENYTGTVFTMANLSCDCEYDFDIDWSELDWEYEIIHEYYAEVDGEMVLVGTANYGPEIEDYGDGDVWQYYIGEYGQVITGYDNKVTEFEGKTYEYIGSYDSWILFEDERTEDVWAENEKEYFTLDENDYTDGLVLRYELVEDEDNAPADEDTDKKDQDIKDDEDVKQDDSKEITQTTEAETQESESVSDVPLTGDETNIATCAAMALISLGMMLTLVMARKRQEEK